MHVVPESICSQHDHIAVFHFVSIEFSFLWIITISSHLKWEIKGMLLLFRLVVNLELGGV